MGIMGEGVVGGEFVGGKGGMLAVDVGELYRGTEGGDGMAERDVC